MNRSRAGVGFGTKFRRGKAVMKTGLSASLLSFPAGGGPCQSLANYSGRAMAADDIDEPAAGGPEALRLPAEAKGEVASTMKMTIHSTHPKDYPCPKENPFTKDACFAAVGRGDSSPPR